jgi:hypothetical protein
MRGCQRRDSDPRAGVDGSYVRARRDVERTTHLLRPITGRVVPGARLATPYQQGPTNARRGRLAKMSTRRCVRKWEPVRPRPWGSRGHLADSQPLRASDRVTLLLAASSTPSLVFAWVVEPCNGWVPASGLGKGNELRVRRTLRFHLSHRVEVSPIRVCRPCDGCAQLQAWLLMTKL